MGEVSRSLKLKGKLFENKDSTECDEHFHIGHLEIIMDQYCLYRLPDDDV